MERVVAERDVTNPVSLRRISVATTPCNGGRQRPPSRATSQAPAPDRPLGLGTGIVSGTPLAVGISATASRDPFPSGSLHHTRRSPRPAASQPDQATRNRTGRPVPNVPCTGTHGHRRNRPPGGRPAGAGSGRPMLTAMSVDRTDSSQRPDVDRLHADRPDVDRFRARPLPDPPYAAATDVDRTWATYRGHSARRRPGPQGIAATRRRLERRPMLTASARIRTTGGHR